MDLLLWKVMNILVMDLFNDEHEGHLAQISKILGEDEMKKMNL